jgi:hypothetical protein
VSIARARLFHGLTAAVALGALVLQLVLVLNGGRVLDEQEVPDLGIRVARYVAYFTIQSNLLVAAATVMLARDPQRDGVGFRIVRLGSVSGIAVTGFVHFTLLRPLLDLDGADHVADKLLHMVVPVLALLGWVFFGPRPRVDLPSFWWVLAWPLAWLAEALVVGGATGWYPYPFLDHREDGWDHVLVASVGITVLFLLTFALVAWIDRRARPAPTGSVAP